MTKRCPCCRKAFDANAEVCPDDGATLTVAPALDPGTAQALAKDYRILDWLGSGGMGAVFIAEQIRVGNRKVALKILHRKFSEDQEFITRFENEAASTGRINHPNVITIYESKQASDGSLYIAMELVEGESLTEHLRKRGRLPVTDTVDIVVQCCKALQAAHRLGIIHRDIKPDNIMLTRDPDGGTIVKILDFGIAKLKDSGGHTVTGSVLGTPAYMSYEQANGLSSEKLDGRSDVYSLGIVTYVMLAGRPPFRAETPVGYITKHLSEAPAPVRTLRPDLPAAVEAAVMKSLEKDREHRYETATDFGTALREAARTATASAPATVGAPPTPSWRARRPTATTSPADRVSEPRLPLGTPTTPTPPLFSPAATPSTPAARRVTPGPHVVSRAVPSYPTPTVSPPPVVSRSATPVPLPASAPQAGAGSGLAAPASAHRVRVEAPAKRVGGGPSWDGLAVAVWGVRTLLSWGMAAHALILLALFVRPFVAGFLPASTFLPVEVMAQALAQPIGQWVPSLRYEGVDFVPLVLAAVLLILRPRITMPLWRLESRWRARALAEEALS